MMSNARRSRLAPPIAALSAALMLSACASVFDVLPEKMGGLPANAPQRANEQPNYPNVYEPMQPHDVQKLSDDQQKTAELELLALRESQTSRANPQPLPEPMKKKPAAKKKGASKEAQKKGPDKSAARKPAEKQQN